MPNKITFLQNTDLLVGDVRDIFNAVMRSLPKGVYLITGDPSNAHDATANTSALRGAGYLSIFELVGGSLTGVATSVSNEDYILTIAKTGSRFTVTAGSEDLAQSMGFSSTQQTLAGLSQVLEGLQQGKSTTLASATAFVIDQSNEIAGVFKTSAAVNALLTALGGTEASAVNPVTTIQVDDEGNKDWFEG